MSVRSVIRSVTKRESIGADRRSSANRRVSPRRAASKTQREQTAATRDWRSAASLHTIHKQSRVFRNTQQKLTSENSDNQKGWSESEKIKWKWKKWKTYRKGTETRVCFAGPELSIMKIAVLLKWLWNQRFIERRVTQQTNYCLIIVSHQNTRNKK